MTDADVALRRVRVVSFQQEPPLAEQKPFVLLPTVETKSGA
jgi:hypothetical protein